MDRVWFSFVVGALHVALVLVVAGKYAWDRARLPREWVEVKMVDPDSLLRGRYLVLETVAKPGARFEYFVPEHSPLGTPLRGDQHLWAEVTKAPNGLRPIRVELRREGR